MTTIAGLIDTPGVAVDTRQQKLKGPERGLTETHTHQSTSGETSEEKATSPTTPAESHRDTMEIDIKHQEGMTSTTTGVCFRRQIGHR